MRAILVCALLAGCSTTSELVQVRVPCKVEVPVEPGYRFLPPYDSVHSGVADLLGDRELSQAYTKELKVALEGCLK